MTATVDPASARYARQRVLDGIGRAGQSRLAAAHVVVVGAGGLGSTLLPGLAAAGVGVITIVDHDAVADTDLHRQTLYGPADVGRPKADAAAAAIARISPDTRTVAHPRRFAREAADDLLRDADLVVDASDNSATRYLANDAAARRGIPLVWGSALGWSGQVGVASEAAGVDYRDLVPEDAAPVDDSCETVGVLPAVCAVIGAMMTAEVLKLLTGAGDPLIGRAQVYDARGGGVRELTYRRAPGRGRTEPAPSSGAGHDAPHPSAPALSAPDLSAPELAALLASVAPPRLVDVREPWEARLASIPGSELRPLGSLADGVADLDRHAELVLYCHHGMRSGTALRRLEQLGFTSVRHLTGGIDAWSTRVDPSVPRY